MAGAALYACAEASALFVDEPFVRCADGRWRIANPLKRPWETTPQLEQLVDGDWQTLTDIETDLVAGAVRVQEPVSRLRGRGRFFPLTLLGEASGWRLEAGFTSGARNFAGRRGAGKLASATVVLEAIELEADSILAAPLYALLEAPGGEYACLAASGRLGDSREVRLSVGPDGLAFAAS